MRSERRSLLRLRGEGGEGLRRRLGGLRLLSLRSESRCLNEMGLLARLCGDDLLGDDLLGLDLERLGGVRFRGDERRLDLLGERRLRLLGLSGLLALFFPLDRDLDLELALLLDEYGDLLRLLLRCFPFSLVASRGGLPSGLEGSSFVSGKAEGLAVTCNECCCFPLASSRARCAFASFLTALSRSSIATAAAVSVLSTSCVC